MTLSVYEVHHSGHYLGGLSIVVAETEERALALTKFEMAEHGLSAADIHIVRKLNLDREKCFVLNDGDY